MSTPTTTAPARPATGRAIFLRRALTTQATIGAIAPTSATLATRLAALVPVTAGQRVLELGAGTGAISAAIGPRLGPGAVHLAVERDPTLLAGIAHVAPRAQPVVGDAADMGTHLAAAGLDAADVIISSLPWSNFDPAFARRVLAAACSILAPHGVFATIAYHPARLHPRARRFRRLLDSSFAEVVPTATTWASLPPARLLICRRHHCQGNT